MDRRVTRSYAKKTGVHIPPVIPFAEIAEREGKTIAYLGDKKDKKGMGGIVDYSKYKRLESACSSGVGGLLKNSEANVATSGAGLPPIRNQILERASENAASGRSSCSSMTTEKLSGRGEDIWTKFIRKRKLDLREDEDSFSWISKRVQKERGSMSSTSSQWKCGLEACSFIANEERDRQTVLSQDSFSDTKPNYSLISNMSQTTYFGLQSSNPFECLENSSRHSQEFGKQL